MRSLIFFLLAVITVPTSSENSDHSTDLSPTLDHEDPAAEFKRFNIFDIEFLQTFQHETRNFVVSPLSVKAILGMVLEGAAGKSSSELMEAMRITNDTNIKEIFRKIYQEISQEGSATLALANQIFVSTALENNINPNYQNIIGHYYGGNFSFVDFENPHQAAMEINDWVANKTRKLIRNLISADKIKSHTTMVLANALYFKDTWKLPFDPKNTKTIQCFNTRSGCKPAVMMEIQDGFLYGNIVDLEAKAVEIPYQDNRYSMIILLPDNKNGINLLIRDFSHFSLDRVLQKMEGSEVLLTLPRFTIDYSEDIIEKLKLMKINSIFDPSANLSNIFTGKHQPVGISTMMHKVKIHVTEEGTEAAAATGGVVIPLMGASIRKFNANHPFLFFVRSTSNGHILFTGVVHEPNEPKYEQQKKTGYIQERRVPEGYNTPIQRNVQQKS